MWKLGRAVPFLGIFFSIFRHCVFAVLAYTHATVKTEIWSNNKLNERTTQLYALYAAIEKTMLLLLLLIESCCHSIHGGVA